MSLSIGLAFLISLPLASSLSRRFTRPLERLKATAQGLAEGDYDLRTGIDQKDEIGDLARDMDFLALALGEASKEKNRQEEDREIFLSNISHELRTPVTVIRSSLEALRDGVIEGEEKKDLYYQQMLAESIQLERLISDLLELSLLRSTEFSLNKERVYMAELLADILRGMESLALKKNLKLLYEAGSGFSLLGDYGRLRQMVAIVVDNAIKFSPEDAVIRIEENLEAGSYRLTIEDQGPGFSADHSDYVFSRAFNRSQKAENSGAGLGLSIAKEIARVHGFEIEIKSRPGQSRVSFIYNQSAGDGDRSL